ncbi:MAG: DUF2007 domain-containing protein [Verrucomicrobia bacterium]|nr:DUF2007 domain-containing protein [Verrucomicrobiota bacterium]
MNMVTIANCHSLDEAQGLKMLLEGAGIPSFIPDENTSSVAPHHFLTTSGVRIQVLEEHVEEAKRLIEQTRET